MRLSSISVVYRMAFAIGAPIVALLVFALLFAAEHRSNAARMERVAELTEFGRNLSSVIHELQRERGNSAGFVGSGGAGEFAARLNAQRNRTDVIVEQYFEALTHHNLDDFSAGYRNEINNVSRQLREISAHRTAVDGLGLSLGEAVAPYTQKINTILSAFVEEVHESDDAGLTEGMISLLNLMEAKENAGIERAVGANSLSSGAVNRNNHNRLIQLQSAQEAYIAEFEAMMGEGWSERLQTALAPTVADVQAYRDLLGDAGYGGTLPSGEGGVWFDASTRRIDAMMDVETQFATYLVNRAEERFAASNRTSWIAAISALVVTGLTIWFSVAIATGVIVPIKVITSNLEAIAAGDKNIQISGADRKDEIGVLARAARDFLVDSEQRRQLEKEKMNRDRKAVEERAALMKTMSQEVETASERSLGRVVESATSIRERSVNVKDSLDRARAQATSVADQANLSREQSVEAAEQADQLITAINEVTQQIARSDELARDAVGKAEASGRTVSELRDAAAQIGSFVEIINGLAEQTNLLALNATIEAARAGEAGKGFAVVAAEVKALASQTNTSASEISDRVGSIQERTGETVDAIDAISSAIDSLSEVTTAVSAAMEEQRASTSSFRDFVDQTRTATEAVASGVEEIAQVAASVSEEAVTFASTAEEMSDMSELARFEIPRIVTAASSRADEEAEAAMDGKAESTSGDIDESEDIALWG